ncbi:MAG: GNAT family N-acetyltransferase [Synechococcales bacterium]|nr:GNAT family N-acetyltransferase [Synechococcales bacterium]
MLMLTTRAYQGERDLEKITDLLNICEKVDQLDAVYTVAEMQREASSPTVNPESNWQLWEDSSGRLVGFGELWIPTTGHPLDGHFWFRVHPQSRGQGLEADMIAWGESRMRQIGRERAVPVLLRSGCRSTLVDRLQLLEAHGFENDRCFLTMTRSLTDAIIPAQLPPGFTVRSVLGAPEAEAWVEMFNQSFIDHWNHHPLTVEEYLHDLTDPDYRPELDLVAIAPDGTLAAFCYSSIDSAFNQQKGRREGWIAVLGTRRGFRRQGLGRAMLLSGLHRLKAAGMDTAKLGVDTQNPNCARSLYESVGFQLLYTNLAFAKSL